jgi:UDP-glucose 4-epimerase
MKVLITGGAGFIGSHLTRELLKENDVCIIDNLSNGTLENIKEFMYHPKFKFIELDLININELNEVFEKNKFERVFHLAANSDIQKGVKNRSVDLNNTFLSTFNILECMRKFEVKEIIFASTSAIYGETEKIINEDTPVKPVSFYGAAKLCSEAYINAFVNSFGINALILRFPNVVGENGTHGILFDFINKLKKNKKELIVLGDGEQNKPYIYVKELVKGILYFSERHEKPIDFINISPDDTIKVKRIAELVCEEMKIKPKIIFTGGNKGWIGDVPFYKYNNEKMKKKGFKLENNSEQAIKISLRMMLK